MVGLFVFIGLAIFLSGILIIGNLHETFTKKIKLVSFFDDVYGLQTGNNVWFSGVKVGTVSKIKFFGTSQVEVTLNIDVKAQEYIRQDARVKISSDGLIGNRILVIYGGSRRAREVMEGDSLKVDATFSQDDMVNTLQENNKNLLAVTTDLKTLSRSLVAGEGSMGKLLHDNSLYDNLNTVAISLHQSSLKVQLLVNSLSTFSAGLNEEGTLANELVSDTIVFPSIRSFANQLKQIGDSATMLVSHLNAVTNDPQTPVGVLLHDKDEAVRLKVILKNLESSSKKLDDDLEAAQHSFLLKGYFKKQKKAKNDSIKNSSGKK